MNYVFLIGAQKAGSTFLHNLLAQHPSICSFPKKEPMFFSKPCFDGLDLNDLYEVMPGHKFILDSSASYMHVAGTHEQILRRIGPDAKVLAVVRNPVDRAISAYLHQVKHGREFRSADEVFGFSASSVEEIVEIESRNCENALLNGRLCMGLQSDMPYRDPIFSFKYMTNSLYDLQLSVWARQFAFAKIVYFDDLAKQPERVVSTIFDSLGISNVGFSLKPDVDRNETRLRRLKAIARAGRLDQHDFFKFISLSARLLTQRYGRPHIRSRFSQDVIHLLQKSYNNLEDMSIFSQARVTPKSLSR